MRSNQEIYSDIKWITSKKCKVCIFGAGRVGRGLGLELIDILGITPSFYCDNDSENWGHIMERNLPCISPDDMKGMDSVACIVMLGQHAMPDVLKQIQNYKSVKIIITYDEIVALQDVQEAFFSRYIVNDNANKAWNFNQDEIYRIKNRTGNKIAIYSCITGAYDDAVDYERIIQGVDYYLISDKKPNCDSAYIWIDARDVIPKNIEDNVRRNRYCKIMSPFIFEEYDYVMYVDGNVKINKSMEIEKYISKLGRCGFATHNHAFTNCIYEEAIKIIALGIENRDTIINQVFEYKKEGFPRGYGQCQNAILLWDTHNEIARKLMSDWWKQVYTKSFRDQLSLMYCAWKNSIRADEINMLGGFMRGNSDFCWLKRHHAK